MRPVIPSAGALLAASGLLYLSFPAMAFVGLSSFALINEGRLLLQRARLPSHSGGLEGSPPGPPTLAQDDRGRRGKLTLITLLSSDKAPHSAAVE